MPRRNATVEVRRVLPSPVWRGRGRRLVQETLESQISFVWIGTPTKHEHPRAGAEVDRPTSTWTGPARAAAAALVR